MSGPVSINGRSSGTGPGWTPEMAVVRSVKTKQEFEWCQH